MSKFILVGLTVLIALSAGVLVVINSEDESKVDDYVDLKLDEGILSFTDCERAGYPVMESHPRRCALPDGRVFAEEIKVEPVYQNSSADMIVVENPHPGGVVGKEFVVTGMARGSWFFEASFPIEVIGADGNVIAGSFATAESDWMTTEFVEFKSEIIDLPSAYLGPATLIVRKDNASGLPEHDASVSIPIVVEY